VAAARLATSPPYCWALQNGGNPVHVDMKGVDMKGVDRACPQFKENLKAEE